MLAKAVKILSNVWLQVLLLAAITAAITAQSVLLKPKTFAPNGPTYTHYNNYIIFKQSYFHLVSHSDLYQLYPAEHWDYYKYSPTFAFLMAPLAALPNAPGLFIWNLLNVLVLLFAIRKLPLPSDGNRLAALGLILIELITSIQNSQCNALIAGLIIFAFILLERKQIALASLLIVATIFIKLFGIVALSLFIFYPHKIKAILYTIGWGILLAILPLIVVPVQQLIFLYHSWINLLQNDHATSWGLSVAGWLYTWFGIQHKELALAAGTVLFCIPLLKFKQFTRLRFKLFFLSSVLIWVVIFNHKAESPTFIIAICGVAIWFFAQRLKPENVVLVILAFVFTVLSPTDIFPKVIRDMYVTPYVLKAVPCILIWLKITADLIFYKHDTREVTTASTPG